MAGPHRDAAPAPAAHFLAGGGEMGARIRAFDWSRTSLGPVDRWPQSLRSAVSILLPSKAQIVLFWGPELITLYNDTYRPVFGAKHPRVLGLPAREAWRELWDAGLRELIEGVVNTGVAFWASDRSFSLERFGYAEETFFDVSYDPVRDETGQVGGVFCIVSETTARVVGERRLQTLRELSARTSAEAKSVAETCAVAARTLAGNQHDLPFVLLYLLDADGDVARLAGVAGLAEGSPAAPPRVDLTAAAHASGWPLGAVAASGRAQSVTGLGRRFGALPSGVWPEPTHTAVVLPIRSSGQERVAGFLVAGISPRRPLDDQYHGFLDLLASQIAIAVANARAFEEASRRAEELAELDRAKTAFFTNISHEFRTPLTLMLGPLEDALQETSERWQRDRLEVIHRNGLRLQKLVNTLLDFSRIEAGRVKASYEPTDLAQLTAELASTFRSAFDRAGLRLLVDCPPLCEPVFVDRDMWEKVVLNLLSNAFKFTLKGETEVRMRELEHQVELTVRDTGTGIAAEHLPHVFERFHRVEGARARTHEGTGIGLALVQELIKLHGGTIRVESVAGAGSTFTVTVQKGSAHLPAERVRPGKELTSTALEPGHYLQEALRWLPQAAGPGPAEPVAEADGRAAAPARPRIVWADDNADMRDYVHRLLAPRYDVEAVADGEAALAAVHRQPPDLVLTDVMMPRLDGFGLLRALRGDDRTRAIPVVFLSARAGEEARVEGIEVGADDYLVKPFSARELLAHVSSRLELARVRAHVEAQLKEADRRKDEFLAMLAHELRNPLAPIRNVLELMKHGELKGEQLEEARRTMQRQLNQLVRLIDDLLDVSRISRGKMQLHPERVRLDVVVEQAVEVVDAAIASAGHELTVDLPSAPVFLHADPVRLTQVLGNLLDNACKYTRPGGAGRISLTARVEGDEVAISIADNGIGIPAPMLDRIFHMFVQVDGSLERSRGGLGIGLTLVQRLVEMHGGSIRARSDGPERGSEFVVRLPTLVTGEPAQRPPPASTPATSAPRRILVVDDNEDSATSLAMLLQFSGSETHIAFDGFEAVSAAARLRPDVVLLDIGLPKLNGYEVARQLRSQPWGKSMVLVAMTGMGRDEDRREATAAGFNGYLVKPIDYDTLLKLLAELQSTAV